MPWAVAGAAIGAAGSIAGGAMQAGAVGGSAKQAARAQEEAKNILLGSLSAVGPRLEQGKSQATSNLNEGFGTASAALQNDYTSAGQRLAGAADQATGYLNQAGSQAAGYLDQGRATIGQGVTGANALLQPYVDQGGRALQLTGDLSGANGVDAGRAAMANFQSSPGYQFALDQGLRAVDAGAAARGMLVSGGTRAAEMQYGQGLAAQDFASYYNRLSGLASQGLQASNTAGGNIMQGAAGQSGIDRAQAQTALTQGGALAGVAQQQGAAQAANDTGLANALASTSMTHGAQLAQNEQQAGAAISNLYTQNSSQVAGVSNQQAQTATSTGTALAGIYGNQAQGLTNSITSGLNSYTYLNALGPQATGQQGGYTGYSNPSMLPSDQQYMKPVVY